MSFHPQIPIVSLFAAAACLCGCAGAGQRLPAAPERDSNPSPAAQAPAPAPIALPPLSELGAQLRAEAGPRSPSYVPADLLRQAEDFSTTLPHQHVTATAGGVAFAPDWLPQSPDFAGLSFAMYPFNVKGFGGDPLLYYSWISAPPVPANSYIALANWDTGAWDWFTGAASGMLTLPGIAAYADFGGNLLACVVVTGTTACELDWLRIGSRPPEPSLAATPSYGLTPFTVNFSAAGSSDPDGTIAEYQWDPEGDGTFSASSGTAPEFSYEYTATGDFAAAVRVIDDSGVYQVRTLTITAVNEANFSYGTATRDESARSVLVTSDGQLLTFGIREVYHGEAQVLVTLISPAGTSGIAREWGGEGFEFLIDAAPAADGSFYACGSTSSFSARTAGLLQRWSAQGELEWSRKMTGTDAYISFSALLVSGDSIYACGQMSLTITGNSYALVCRIGLDGTLIWAKSMISPDDCTFEEIAYFSPIAFGVPSVRLCGYYESSADDWDCLYAEYDLDGNLLASKTWGKVGTPDYGTAITVFGANPATYVTGMTMVSGQSAAMLGRPGGTTAEVDGLGDALIPKALRGLNLLANRRNGSDSSYSTVLASFSSALELLAVQDVSAIPDGSTNALEMTGFGAGALVVAGYQSNELPLAGTIDLNVQPSAIAWTDITPSQGSPSQLELSETPIDVTLPSGFEFNRQEPDLDIYIYLSR